MGVLIHLFPPPNSSGSTISELMSHAGQVSSIFERYIEADRRVREFTNGFMSLLSPIYAGDDREHWLIDKHEHKTWISLSTLKRENNPYESCPHCCNTPADLQRFGSPELLSEYSLRLSGGKAAFLPDQKLLGIDEHYNFCCLAHERPYLYATTFRYFHMDAPYSACCPLCEAASPSSPHT